MSLPANMWRLVAQHADHRTLRALRGTSVEARRGAANQHNKRTKLAAAYRSTTATTVRPLVAALIRQPGPPKTVRVGRYELTVTANPSYPVVSVIWSTETENETLHPWHHYSKLVGWYDLGASEAGLPSAAEVREMGPGAATVVRLVKAAFKAAFG
jgi:hypothetical protein